MVIENRLKILASQIKVQKRKGFIHEWPEGIKNEAVFSPTFTNENTADFYYIIGKDNETSADLSLYVEDTLYNRFVIDSTYKVKVLNGHIENIYPK